jgi:pimeloyl-ACP methyl ester carboxylesterase/tetratricopeptide (TPR) repeat protein
MIRKNCIAFTVAGCVLVYPAAAQSLRDERPTGPLAPELAGLGSLEYRVTTRVPAAQRFFNQGLRLLYAFNHAEALRAFREAARLDPRLAMAYWGQAIALGPNLNAPMTPENGRLAFAAIQRAQAESADDRERALIAALARRYQPEPGGDRRPFDLAYAAAMTQLAERHPDDPDIQTLYADAVMNTMPWDYWQKNGVPKPETATVIAALERIIARQPQHPGAHHYYIHVMEASVTPERAESSADRLGALMPAAGHMVHMPAHIYLRVGRYADAAEANVRAIAADEDYLAQCQAQGLYPVSYYPHNLHFLWAAATLEGRSAVAIDAARQVAAKVPHHHAGALSWTADFPVTPLLAYARFGRWREILTEPTPPANQPYAVGIWRYARGLAFVAQGRLEHGATELGELRRVMAHEAFSTTFKDLPLLTNLQIASRIVAGELAARQGRRDESIRQLEEAVTIEDGIPYNEPPVWHQPPRQVLGALLVEAGRARDAEQVYREDLKRFPENGWSLFGLAQSLERQGRTSDANVIRGRFATAWRRADITLTSSRVLTSNEKFASLSTGVQMEYVEQGPADGLPVVFLHGVTDSWRSFERVLPLLPPNIHAFALSARGHGDSSRPEAGYRYADMARDVRAFMDAVGLERAVVVGHSMGSLVAQRFVVDYPDRTAGLVLMGAFPSLFRHPEITEFYRSTIAPLHDPLDVAFVREWQRSTLANPVTADHFDAVVSETLKVPARVWRAAFEAFLSTPDFSAELTRVSVPTLIAWGDKDAYAHRDSQERLRAVLRGARFRVYEGGGHGFHWEDPARFAADLAAFLISARIQ